MRPLQSKLAVFFICLALFVCCISLPVQSAPRSMFRRQVAFQPKAEKIEDDGTPLRISAYDPIMSLAGALYAHQDSHVLFKDRYSSLPKHDIMSLLRAYAPGIHQFLEGDKESEDDDDDETYYDMYGTPLDDEPSPPVSQLSGISTTMVIDVILVGFDSTPLGADASTRLSRLLEGALRKEDYVSVLQLSEQDGTTGASSSQFSKESKRHKLPIRNKFTFNFHQIDSTSVAEGISGISSLHTDLKSSLAAALSSEQPSTPSTPPVVVPVETVDKLVKSHWQRNVAKRHNPYTVYLLNINDAVIHHTYSSSSSSTSSSKSNIINHYPPLGSCETVMWTGDEDRYLWLDVSAGPIHYGPETTGDGAVMTQSLPLLTAYQLETQYGEFSSSIAAFLHNACDHLFHPSLASYPMSYTPAINIQIIIIRETPNSFATTLEKEDDYYTSLSADLKVLEEEMSSRGHHSFVSQQVTVSQSHLDLETCEECRMAFAFARKSYTSTVVQRVLRTQVHPYLDSAELHYWLNHFQPAIFAKANIAPSMPDRRVIPVYLFALDSKEILLLDRYHQALPLVDSVLAVQTRAGEMILDYECQGNSVGSSASSVVRPLLSSVLQTAFGVAPIQQRRSDLHNSVEDDYVFSTLPTPFGPFTSAKQSVHFLRDAAKRSVVYSHMSMTLSILHKLASDVHEKLKDASLSDVMTDDTYREALIRLSAVEYNLRTAATYVGRSDFDLALHHVILTGHDVRSSRDLIHQALQSFRPLYDCSKPGAVDAWTLTRWTVYLILLSLIPLFLYQRKITAYLKKKSWFRKYVMRRRGGGDNMMENLFSSSKIH